MLCHEDYCSCVSLGYLQQNALLTSAPAAHADAFPPTQENIRKVLGEAGLDSMETLEAMREATLQASAKDKPTKKKGKRGKAKGGGDGGGAGGGSGGGGGGGGGKSHASKFSTDYSRFDNITD